MSEPKENQTQSKEEKESKEKKKIQNDDPGASRHGNFINYYQFHSAEERVQQIPLAVCQRPSSNARRKYVALDVGCNAGNLTLELYKYLKEKLPDHEIAILGIDLDPVLIERAREQNDQPESVSFEVLDFMSDEREAVINSYLKQHQVERFDTSFCFSITMWIHINGGDPGLHSFLSNVCACSESLLLEPQPWNCYRNASRRLRRADKDEFSMLSTLTYRGNIEFQIQRIVKDRGLKLIEISKPNKWQRRLLYFARDAVD